MRGLNKKQRKLFTKIFIATKIDSIDILSFHEIDISDEEKAVLHSDLKAFCVDLAFLHPRGFGSTQEIYEYVKNNF